MIYFSCRSFHRSERLLDEVVIALVGKYTALEDAYASVLKALNHAALFCNRKVVIRVSEQLFISIESRNFSSSSFMQPIWKRILKRMIQ